MSERLFAIELARRAAEAILAIRAEGFAVELKGVDDPVTAADRAANEIIVDALRAAYPADTIVAEESELPRVRERRCWFVDPLDGTKEFVAGIPEYCVMIGLAIDGRATVGAMVVPTTGLTLSGGPDGAFVGDERVTLGARSSLRLVVSRSRRSSRLDAILSALGGPPEIPCGSVGVKVAKLLLGEADAYVHPGGGPKLWDLCAPEAIVRAAGGVFTDERGVEIDYTRADVAHETGMVVASREQHARLLEAIALSSRKGV